MSELSRYEEDIVDKTYLKIDSHTSKLTHWLVKQAVKTASVKFFVQINTLVW